MQSNFQTHYLAVLRSDGRVVDGELHLHAAAPAWSPDGTKIAFYGEQGISQLGGEYVKGNGIWLVDAQGKNPQQLVAVDHVKNIAWSPDGTKLAFEVDPPSVAPEIRVVDAVGGREIRRLPGEQPAWSPNSQRLAIKTCAPECGLWHVNFDGSDAKQLTSHGTDSYPAWSPTGEYLAFTSQRDGNWEIYRLRLANGELQNLTNRPATDIAPVFSPDGQAIYMRTDDQGGGDSWRITAISVNGGNERLVKEGVGPSDDWGLARPAVR